MRDANRASCYVSYRGSVYDITQFLPDHPGGDDIIMKYAGQDIGYAMADENEHVHSRSAYDMLEEYKVGELGGDEKIVSEGESTSPRLRPKYDNPNVQIGYHAKIFIQMRRTLWPITTGTSFWTCRNRSWRKSGGHHGPKSTTCRKYTIHVI